VPRKRQLDAATQNHTVHRHDHGYLRLLDPVEHRAQDIGTIEIAEVRAAAEHFAPPGNDDPAKPDSGAGILNGLGKCGRHPIAD